MNQGFRTGRRIGPPQTTVCPTRAAQGSGSRPRSTPAAGGRPRPRGDADPEYGEVVVVVDVQELVRGRDHEDWAAPVIILDTPARFNRGHEPYCHSPGCGG